MILEVQDNHNLVNKKGHSLGEIPDHIPPKLKSRSGSVSPSPATLFFIAAVLLYIPTLYKYSNFYTQPSQHLLSFVPVCNITTGLCGHMHRCVYMCKYISGDQRSTLDTFLNHSPFYFLRRSFTKPGTCLFTKADQSASAILLYPHSPTSLLGYGGVLGCCQWCLHGHCTQ